MVYITIVNGVINQLITRGHHIVGKYMGQSTIFRLFYRKVEIYGKMKFSGTYMEKSTMSDSFNRRIHYFCNVGFYIYIYIYLYPIEIVDFPLRMVIFHSSVRHSQRVCWLVVTGTLLLLFHILRIIIIPIDELIFFRGVAQPPSRYVNVYMHMSIIYLSYVYVYI